ncbi:MAG: hypothetical protein EON54_07845 [Alcaligenaceae bacterium]|jgi:hypothetical protein|nr:MAG: hypothetical protein EON54_07845 [Alcaligenaceae bacterium]
MTIDRLELLSKLSQQPNMLLFEKASQLLLDPAARPIDGAPTHEDVAALLPTLKARLKNSLRAGKTVFGLEETIASLSPMIPPYIVHGYGYISLKAAGNIYLSSDNKKLLGAVIVER